MKPTAGNASPRAQLVEAAIQAYMDLFAMMQSTAIDHWLMHELTFAQARALITLAARKTLTISQLGRLLHVGNSTASILVQHLVDRGLVTRSEHESDRRQTVIRLSAQGAEIGAGRLKEREAQWQRWLDRLGDDELSALSRGLVALQEVVRAETQAGPERTPAKGGTR